MLGRAVITARVGLAVNGAIYVPPEPPAPPPKATWPKANEFAPFEPGAPPEPKVMV